MLGDVVVVHPSMLHGCVYNRRAEMIQDDGSNFRICGQNNRARVPINLNPLL
jgi:hypothetical protein